MTTRMEPAAAADRLRARAVTIGYGPVPVCDRLDLDLPDGGLTVIVGPNACGKSTLLRALARLLAPTAGVVELDGRDIRSYGAKEVARRLGLLPQSSLAPDGITVADLVARGRYPHQSMLRHWSSADEAAVADALAATRVDALSGRQVDELSGGQRQRVWVSMVLAQQTPIILLDEPTTFLDIAHQIDLLELVSELNREGRTVVAVLHDLNHACRYATHLVVMKDGAIVAQGAPADIITADLVREVFGLPCLIIDDPVTHTPLVIPLGSAQARRSPTAVNARQPAQAAASRESMVG